MAGSTTVTVPAEGCPTCSCGCGCTDGCDCGTDCATGAVNQPRSPLGTSHVNFSFAFSNLATNGTGGSAANPNFGMGTNVFVSNWAYAVNDGSNIAFIWGPNRAVWFHSGGGAALYGSRYTMSVSGGYYVLTDPDTGAVYKFSTTTGLLMQTTTAGLQNTINTPDGATPSQIDQTTRSYTFNVCNSECDGTTPVTTSESLVYTYLPATGSLPALLEFVTLTRSDATTVQIRRLAMTYYGSGDASGNAGDLMTVSLQQLEGTEWATISTEYFRYYTGAEGQPGYQHGLKFVVGPESFARLSRAANPYTAPDEFVAQFADYYYEYTDFSGAEPRRVTKSVTDGGTLPHLFAYVKSGFTNAYNNWYLKCMLTQNDGSQKIIYSNYTSQVMLTDFWDTPDYQPNGRWIDYTQYDPSGACATAIYSPAAINMDASQPPYNDAYANLNVQLNTNAGLVTTRSYESVAGYPNYLDTEYVQQGTAGTPTPIKSFTYTSQSASPAAIVLPVSATNYPDGATAVTTSFTYPSFFSGTVQVEEKVTALPEILAGAYPTGQNGDGHTYTITETFDSQGRPTQRYDPVVTGSSLTTAPSTQWIYDESTGAVIQSIRNPNTGSPNWENVLTTDFTVDLLGRTLQTLGPAFLSPLPTAQATDEAASSQGALVQVRPASWTVYRDVAHEVWTAAGYATGSMPYAPGGTPSTSGYLTPVQYAFMLQNPVSITRMDHDGRTIDSIAAVRLPSGFFTRASLSGQPPRRPMPEEFVETDGALSAGDAFPQISFVRWSHNVYNDAHDLVAVRRYANIPAVGAGTPSPYPLLEREGNYDETRFGYDLMNRRNRTRAPGGTITRTVFDVRDNPIDIYVGTDDAGATDEAPDGFGAPGNNMQNTVSNFYDNGNPVGGDNLLTSIVRHIDFTNDNDYQSDFGYDFRHRRTGVTDWINYSMGTYVFTSNTFDNNDNVTRTQQFNSTTNVLDATALIRQSKTFYDYWQRVYQTQRWGVSVPYGTVGNALTGQTWYNALNRPVKQIAEGGSAAYTKTAYDLANRVSATYTGYAPSGDTNNFALNMSDKIFEQTLFTLDAAGNTQMTAYSQRNQGDNTTTGALGPTTARTSYMAYWQDGGGRPIASANYGVATSAPTIPLALPVSSASMLVSQTAYNNRSEAYLVTDPAGMVSRSDSDDAGRTVRTIQNYIPPLPPEESAGELGWGPAAWSSAPATTGPDVNVTALASYTPDNNITTLTAVNPATGNQTTTYLYGVTLPTSSIARNDLLAAVLYPDASDATDSVQFQYNLQSQPLQKQDQNGSVHEYFRDQLGRQISDQVTTLGTNVNGAVRRIDTAYEIRGMVNLVTSYSSTSGGSGSIVNQVSLTYGDFEQLTAEQQNLSASGGPNLTVYYAYNDGSSDSIAPTSITYPSGSTALGYAYTATDDVPLDRPTSISLGGTTVATYAYFGLASVASVTYGTSPAINMTLATSTPSYPGFDAFDRVIDVPWTKSTTGDLAQLEYGYNLASSRTYRNDAKAGTNFDELYGYDGLQRLLAFARGTLTGGDAAPITSPQLQQSWQLDATGNWSTFSSFDLATAAATDSVMQQRVSNPANEITEIGATLGTHWATPVYDRNGNMTTIPQPAAPTTSFPAVFDAWNRLVALTGTATFGYDGLHRRTSLTPSGSSTRWFINSKDWQVLEEYLGSSINRRYVWGIRYIDDLVLRDRVASGSSFNERFYALQDANWNVVAVYNAATNAVGERYAYTAYGACQFLSGTFSPLSGNVSAYDWTVLYTSRALDDSSGLYYYRMRYYHPELGVFVSRDPVVTAGIRNAFAYVLDSPVTLVDPFGLEEKECPSSDEIKEKISEQLKERAEDVEKFKKWIETIKDDKDITGFEGLKRFYGVDDFSKLPLNVLSKATDAAIDVLEQFKPDNACGKWYKLAYLMILKAGQRHSPPKPDDCKANCDLIATTQDLQTALQAPQSDNFAACVDLIYTKNPGVAGAVARSFITFANAIKDGCLKVLKKCKERAAAGGGGGSEGGNC